MTNKKVTRRALLMSVTSLLICISMLLGTTFAWFTDEVTSGVNQIVAGNLDVELYYSVNGDDNWIKVDNTVANLFRHVGTENDLWEPGHTEVAYLKIVNNGTLDLKYNLSVSPYTETPGTNVYDESFNLSTYLRFGATEPSKTKPAAYATRADAQAAVTSTTLLSEYNATTDLLKNKNATGQNEDYIALVVYMPEDTDNHANYKAGSEVPTIEFSVKLVATQAVSENDSFDNTYDAKAPWLGAADTSFYDADTTADEFTITTSEQLAGLAKIVNSGTSTFEGKTVKLEADLDLANRPWTPIGTSANKFRGTFLGNGHTISNLYVEGTNGVGLFGYTFTGAHIEGINVSNAYLSGVNYVGTILGTGYLAANCLKNNSVNNVTIIVTPVLKEGGAEYDDGAKAGGIAGYATNGDIIGNTVKNATITAYRDIGGIVGMATPENHDITVSGNTIENVILNYIATSKYDNNTPNQNMDDYVGRKGTGKVVGTDVDTVIKFENNTGTATKNTTPSQYLIAKSADQAAINSTIANAAGSTVVLPSSKEAYDLSSTVVISEGTSISGAGPEETTIKIQTDNGDGIKVNNKNVSISNVTVDGTAITSGGYRSLINIEADGTTIDNVVLTGGGMSTWNSSILVEQIPSGGAVRINNSTISGAFRGILRESCAADIYIDNCDIDAVYPFNIDGGSKPSKVVVTNSKLHGWTSYSDVDSVTFTNVEFSKAKSGYDNIAAYENTILTNCTFDSDFELYDQVAGFTWTITNCTKNGTSITAENIKQMFSDPDVWNKCTCIVNGVTVAKDD